MIITFPTPYDAVPHVTNGITFDINSDGDYVISGTATAYAYERLYYTRNSLPSWFEFDKDIEFRITTTGTGSSSVYLAVYGYTATGSTRLLQTRTDAVLNVPSSAGYVGLMIRLMVNVNASVNAVTTVKVVIPKTSPSNMVGSPYWYNSNYNPYYSAGYGLPNCTCYAWGRWYEIMQTRPTGLGLHNAETWWNETVNFDKGQVPKLGAIICFADGPYSGLGHVAVLEKINSDGTYTFSNSGYNYEYFYLRTGSPANNYGYERAYKFQGFIYLPDEFIDNTTPDQPPTLLKKPLWFYIKRKPF